MKPKKDESKSSPMEARVVELEAELEAIQTSAEEAKAAQMRALADLENFRRRQEEEKPKWSNQAVTQFLGTVLPSFLELSLGASHSKDKAMQQVVEKFFDTLRAQGLDSINPKTGTAINPEAHEVLMAETGEPGTVVRCLEIGWQYNGQVVVPAKVSGAQSE